MYEIKNMKKKPLALRVEDTLTTYIIENNIEVGEKIPNEFELAELFGVGRSTIREAIKGLVSKNILEVRRGSGTFVINTTTPEDDPLRLGQIEDKYALALDLVEVRLMIEPEIAVLAAKHATNEDFKMLVELQKKVEEEILTGVDHIASDIELHTYIARCSKNKVMEHLIPVINSAVATFGNITNRRLKEETIKTHEQIVNAIVARDAVGAKCAMIAHLTWNRQTILSIIKEQS